MPIYRVGRSWEIDLTERLTGIRSRYATIATGVLPQRACSRVRAPRSTPIATHGLTQHHRLAHEVAARVAKEKMKAQQEAPAERQRAIELARDEPRRVPAIQDPAQGISFRPLAPKGGACRVPGPLRDAPALVVKKLGRTEPVLLTTRVPSHRRPARHLPRKGGAGLPTKKSAACAAYPPQP